MGDTQAFVYVELAGKSILAGRLWAHERRGRESATFEYDREWLRRPDRFALDPALIVGPGPFHTGADQPMFGAIGDSAPDRWGRLLMRRAERRHAESQKREQRSLREIDFLLRVNDESRQGALRFALEIEGPFLSNDAHPIPPVVELPALLDAAASLDDNQESAEELRILLAPGSSLGGARPKSSVRDSDGSLAIAKFPHRKDDRDAASWEAVALSLAENAGVEVPAWRVKSIDEKSVLLSARFDRRGDVRIPFLSAMSMLQARDHDVRNYTEIVDVLREHGSSALADAHQLWRRIVFNVLISNTDDHLRNHGFLYESSVGWRLSPAYDMNPVPLDERPRVLSTAIMDDDTTASLDLALEAASYFSVSPSHAMEIVRYVGAAVSQWRDVAMRLGIHRREIERMSSAFEHDDLRKAQIYRPG